jgi:4-amino-4-deoxy-L-arabinose transferase-like glycosyltransferase
MKKFFSFCKTNTEKISLIIILVISTVWRLYKISDYMTFLGDEGRDVLVVRGILQGHFTLLGPRASAGNFFTGPIYYYMIAPFLWLFHYDPVGPAIFIAFLGIVTTFLVYYFGKKFFGIKAGLIAAALYAVSPLVVSYSRSSWNPNPMPFFSLVILLSLYKAVTAKSWKYFLLSGFLFGIAFQLHYIELFFAVIIAFFMLFGSIMTDKKQMIRRIIFQYLEFFVGFLVGFSPFLAFEARHGFPNTKTIIAFIGAGTASGENVVHSSFFAIVYDVFVRLFGRLVFYYPSTDQLFHINHLEILLMQIGIIICAIASVIVLLKNKNKLAVLMTMSWLVFGVVLFGFYKKPIYDYYFEFMFPLPFLLIGNLISFLYDNKKIKTLGKIVSVIFFLFLFGLNLYGLPFKYPANRQKDQMKGIADFILSKTNNKPFNFALITGGNSPHAYLYFFDVAGNDPVTIENTAVDPQRKTVTNQLFVVCESLPCHPLGNSLWEIAGFGRATISAEWNVSVVQVYKMEHYKGE